jgi:hypothetical protein
MIANLENELVTNNLNSSSWKNKNQRNIKMTMNHLNSKNLKKTAADSDFFFVDIAKTKSYFLSIKDYFPKLK